MMLPTTLPLLEIVGADHRRPARPDAAARPRDRRLPRGLERVRAPRPWRRQRPCTRWPAASPWLTFNGWLIGAAGLALAGLFQFSALKQRCLEQCRTPLWFVTRFWGGQAQRRQAFLLGVHHGLFCVGCCWALMLLMFVVGMGSVGWMLLLGALMAAEKNLPLGAASERAARHRAARGLSAPDLRARRARRRLIARDHSCSSAARAAASSAFFSSSDLRELEVERAERIDDRGGHDDAGEPLVVGRHDVPGRVPWSRSPGSCPRRPSGSRPSSRARWASADRELPVLVGIVEALQEALLLLLLRHVQEELADQDAVAHEVALEVADVLVALLPDRLGDQRRRQLLARRAAPGAPGPRAPPRSRSG